MNSPPSPRMSPSPPTAATSRRGAGDRGPRCGTCRTRGRRAQSQLRGQPHRSALGVSFSADGRYLAASNDNLVTLWRVEDDDSWETQATLKGHSNQVWTLAFLDGGRVLASGGMDRTIKLWDITHVAQRDVLQGSSVNIFALAFEPDGRTLVSADGYGTLKRWDVSTGNEGPPLEVPPKEPVVRGEGRDVTWFLGLHDRTLADNRGRLWDLETGTLLEPLPLPERADFGRPVAFSDDGAILANVIDGRICLWDMATRKEPRTLPDRAGCLDFHGPILASGGDGWAVRLWDVASGEQLSVLDHEDEGHQWQLSSVTFSPDGRTLVSGSWDGTVKVWDVADPAAPSLRHTLAKHVGMVRVVASRPTGRRSPPPARTRPSSCGTRSPAGIAARWSATRARYTAWRSPRTAGSWPRETRRARSACGATCSAP